MPDTEEVSSTPVTPRYSAYRTQDVRSQEIRFVKPEEAFEEAVSRVIGSAGKFLALNRADGDSTALEFRDQMLRDPTILFFTNRTLRSILVGYNNEVCEQENRQTIIAVMHELLFPIRAGFSRNMRNLFIPGIGAYGDKDEKSILSILLNIMGSGGDGIKSQKELFSKIAKFGQEGKVITIDELYEINPHLKGLEKQDKELLHNRLHQIIYLITILEITRRPSFDSQKNKGSSLCCREIMFDAWVKTSRLLQEGFLTVDEVFSSDAPYGLPTGKNLAGHEQELRGKYWAIYRKYMESFYPGEVKLAEESESKKVAILSQESCHLAYLEATTKCQCQESPGKVYETPEKTVVEGSVHVENSRYDFSNLRQVLFVR